jgi:hypothetical protein
MTVERAFRLVHHLDVPESKRHYWPCFSEVIVSRAGLIPDVFQFFESPNEQQQYAALEMHPGCMCFPVTAGRIHTTLQEFVAKVATTKEIIRRCTNPSEPKRT